MRGNRRHPHGSRPSSGARTHHTRWEGSTVPKLPLSEAAHVLGVSTSALRRRLRAGTLAGEKETAPPYRWLVEVSGDAQARPGTLTAADSDRTAAAALPSTPITSPSPFHNEDRA